MTCWSRTGVPAALAAGPAITEAALYRAPPALPRQGGGPWRTATEMDNPIAPKK